ncbi:MAG: hypothetical protein V4598_19395 [Bdellovibrionota bacterium]
MKYLLPILFIVSCSHKERPLQEQQLIQCYLESDTYLEKKAFTAKMDLKISELGTVTSARVTDSSLKDANLNACLSYVVMGAGRPFQMEGKSGKLEKKLVFNPEGKHEL